MSHALTAQNATGWDLWDLRATYFATCLKCFVYLAVLRAVNACHLPWSSHVISLGVGLALWQFVSACMDSAHIWSGWRWVDKTYDEVSSLVYVGLLVFWVRTLWFPERNHLRV